MGFFQAGTFAEEQKKQLERSEKREKNGEFFGEGRFHATLNSLEVKQYKKPGPNKGQDYIMIECTILKVLEQKADAKVVHKEGDLVKIMWGSRGYFEEKFIGICPGLFGVPLSELTEDMVDKLIAGDLNGVPVMFDRIREHYDNADGEAKSYVPDGMTRLLAKAEAKEYKLDKKVMDLLD
jgi:hypothetical protein